MPLPRHEVDTTCTRGMVHALATSYFVGRLLGVLLGAIIASSSGCATLTIPAFDPSGNRIFAPVPTQLTLPQLHGPSGTSVVPIPAFRNRRLPRPASNPRPRRPWRQRRRVFAVRVRIAVAVDRSCLHRHGLWRRWEAKWCSLLGYAGKMATW